MLFSFPYTIEYFTLSVVFTLLLVLTSKKMLGCLQQCGYRNKDFFKWANKKSNMLFTRLTLLVMTLILALSIVTLCFWFTSFQTYLGCLIAFLLMAVYVYSEKYALKVKTNYTKRIKRLIVLYSVILFIIVFGLSLALNAIALCVDNVYTTEFRYAPLFLIVLLLPIILILANAISSIFENAKNKKYIKSATEKINSSKIIKIAITGSFAKTSVKNILAQILGEKFKVLKTPASFNTPLGLAKVINDNNLQDFDIFIAEMGAKNVGDIKTLCEIVKPDFSIITGICPQHIETFKTIDNIISTKGEILTYMNKDGVAVIKEDENTLKLINNCPVLCKIVKNGGDAFIKAIKTSANGIDFTADILGEELNLSCKLLGKHNAENIILACVLAKILNLSNEQIISGVKKLEFIPHRLELTKANGLNILDDGYNANIIGVKRALEVLNDFNGKKVVVTPGIVELGILEEKENINFGKLLAQSSADCIVLVGETLINAVKEGYIDGKGDLKKIKVVSTLTLAQNILKEELSEGDTVLFINDLPDVMQ